MKLNNGEVVLIVDDLSEKHFKYILNSRLPNASCYIHESRTSPFQIKKPI